MSSPTDIRINMPMPNMPAPEMAAADNKKKVLGIALTVIILASFPFIFMDLYLAYNDASCLSQEVPQMALTLKTWLLVSGYLSIAAIGLTMALTIAFYNTMELWMKLFSSIFSLFNLAWSITGAVLFWSYMDINMCDTMTKDYIYAKLIMSFIHISYTIFCGKKRD